ncbi:TlpA disulfide reductase family protein [Polynucleobacter sp. AP-Nino-20-G2]|uniref:TlpA family protein disulfide reductase n=1 Tax=Polynucleobacter sp. AP-Nino-20-G2 TaxID=2576917 RepID=UPI001BFE5B1B|nr:TlpA disulfide reductase family protein [Polynucleobacter sp. AP-Nino-20-G2]QWE17140.1 TlpA family protein disulfide reductase [Polynucleobacter sp. AP-Nino-20-G2]
MKKLFPILSLFLLMMNLAFADAVSIQAYQKGEWSSLLKKNAGQAIAVHFWGVTCAPCAREMPQWGKFLSADRGSKVIFIQVDEVPVEATKKMLSQAHLDAADNYYLNIPFDDYFRHEIDPQWRGETPMTLLIDKNGKITRKTGPINFLALKKWFARGVY